jgi:hypothetical protein
MYKSSVKANKKVKKTSKALTIGKKSPRYYFNSYEKLLFCRLEQIMDDKKDFERRLVVLLIPSAVTKLQKISRTIKLSDLHHTDLKMLQNYLGRIQGCFEDRRMLNKIKDNLNKIIRSRKYTKKDVYSALDLILKLFLAKSS